MKTRSLFKLVVCIALLICAMLVTTACKGVEITPGNGGSVSITPIDPGQNQPGGNDQGGNQSGLVGHVHLYKAEELENVSYDCTMGGIKIWKCACGDIKQEQIAPMQHVLRMYDGKAASCNVGGYNAYVECINSGCNYTTYEEVAPLGHKLQHYDYKAATCTEFGWEAYDVCSRCSYSTYKKIVETGHTFENGKCDCGYWNASLHSHIWDVGMKTEPTCTKAGSVIYTCLESRCGETKTDVIPSKGHSFVNGYCSCGYKNDDMHLHDWKETSRRNPTCTDAGWIEYKCADSRCGDIKSEAISATGHNTTSEYCSCGYWNANLHQHTWNAGVTISATCTASGSIKYTCTNRDCGDTKTEEITAFGHDLTHYEAKAATCTESGYYAYDKCEVCDYTTYATAPALGHNIRSMSGVAATCTSDGYTDYEVCTRGGCNGEGLKKKTTLPALNHDLSYLPNVASTCTTPGLKDRAECKRDGCDYKTETTVPALGHALQHYNGKAATCTEDGYNAYDDCSRCDYSTYSVIPALGHDDVNYEAKEPTCTDFGWNAYSVCKRCSRSTYEERAAIGHSLSNGQCSRCAYFDPGPHTHVWNEGYITTNPTCTATGVKEYTCTYENCGNTKTESVVALGHDNTHYNKKDATCTEDGYYAYDVCNRCGYSTFVEISALGHKYDNGTVITQPTCTGKGVRRYSCERGSCNRTYDVDIDPIGHDWGNWFVAKDATCTASGQKQRVCFNNSAHVDYETIPALGHEWGDYIVQKVATCNADGEKLRYCIRNCGAKTPVEPIRDVDCKPGSDGICIVCGKVVYPPLASPVVTEMNGFTLFWEPVNGAVGYVIKFVLNGEEKLISVNGTSYNLESYFLECSSLNLYIRAMAAEDSENVNSPWVLNQIDIPEGSVVDHGGVGKAVNLLTGPYTDFANSSKLSIFNTNVFNRLDVDDYSGQTPKHHTETIYSESIRDYTNQFAEKNNNKLSIDASVGVSKVLKVTAGYDYEVGSTYNKNTYNNTQAIFYDINYTYTSYQTGIKGYLSTVFAMGDAERDAVLSTLTSASFKADAKRLQNGEITPAKFIELYGTHIITEAIYGASFKAHYEYLSDKTTAETTFGENIKHTINAGIEGAIKGVNINVDVENANTVDTSVFTSETNSKVHTKFTFDALGGDVPADLTSISFAQFSTVCANWISSMQKENLETNGLSRYDLIDLPNGSLYFVWDFLGEEYAEAKDILENYFYAVCDEQYKATNAKINGMYQDFFDFDDETGTLLIDLSARQNPNSGNVNFAGTEYKDGSSVIFNGTQFTIYPKFNGKEVKKVVFKGGYMTRDYSTDQLITNYFNDMRIVFDENWRNDIVVEFQNFRYFSPYYYSALDFSKIESENVKIIVTGEVQISGRQGADVGQNGTIGINASGVNLTIEGEGKLTVTGGDGYIGSYPGGKGGNGGSAIVCDNAIININGTLIATGGNGGNGQIGRYGEDGRDADAFVGHKATDGEDGGRGGNGGKGASAISCVQVTISDVGTVKLTGGDGGRGGRGGPGGDGGDPFYAWVSTSGGSGGAGGTGAEGASAIQGEILLAGDNVVLTSGTNGADGLKGVNGSGKG